MIVDLGCGLKKFRQHNAEDEFDCMKEDVFRVDNLDGEDIDIHQDIISFLKVCPRITIAGALLSHVLEHFYPEEQIEIIDLLYKKMDKGKKIIIYCPHYSSAIAKTHLTHKKLIGYNTFDNFKEDSLERYSDSKFAINKKIIFGKMFKWFSGVANKYPELYEQYLSVFIPAREIRFELVVKK